MRTEALNNILFLDVETVSGVPNYFDLSDRMQNLWNKKALNLSKQDELSQEDSIKWYEKKSAIYAEFNKIVCISVGYLSHDKDDLILKVKSFASDDEKEVLLDFKKLLDKHFNNVDKDFLCGHNIKEFDCPVICRRMLVHGIKHPDLLKLSRKKPWQLGYLLDTLDMWKFGDYKSYISLNLLAAIFDIPSPKEDMDGTMVSKVYWEENDLDRIQVYCQDDVVTTVSVFLKLILRNTFDKVKYV